MELVINNIKDPLDLNLY